MKVYNTIEGIVVNYQDNNYLFQDVSWDNFINRKDLHLSIKQDLTTEGSKLQQVKELGQLLPPVASQDVWASGVTYMRSKEARIEEAQDAGGGDFYARVYEAERPEIFFKSLASKVVRPGGKVRLRRDSKWNVPEPELTLFVCSEGTIEGYTIGNDMSSRDIEGENPLYLPQAKMYDGAASLGPCLFVPSQPIHPDAVIQMHIFRSKKLQFDGQIKINRMKRRHEELVEYLFMETSFPCGVFLMTGTGIVPPDDFTLQSGDEIRISINQIGTLFNTVA